MEAAIMAIVSPRLVLHLHEQPAQQHSGGRSYSDRNIVMLERARAIIRQEAAALESLSNRIDENICLLADHIFSSTGIVVVCGIGKSRLVGEKISAILTSTGTRSITLDPVDALHGDLGRVRAGDVILALSNSGETAELLQLIRAVRQFSVIVAAITGRASSSLAKAADVVLDIGLMQEACALGLAPTTSTMAMAAMGDALALILQERRGFTRQHFARLHPGGSLGRGLMQIRHLMWPLEAIPVFRPDTPLSLALSSMCRAPRKLGVGVVIGEQGKVVGILGGEFIGRLVEHGASPDLSDPVERHMKRPFATVSWHASLDRAAQLFREHEIELMPVHDEQEEFVGLISRQDVLKPS
ncbi:MAG: KpsF/GutQ family sugar-phosphate isomerase [Mesorhizobium sp.]|nr:MAG: KpsF/GutQ family sugar-phosphate isomerase [Mesorhizobium sp.]RWI62807.1 MAG: KpsF/GutQ family sugar-phosphate isomerase [Mesorhizobium sp.]RWI81365.1 MAG: KpsF/GutQ family sugar-phosphate isomerase [Mesorhizobium sp.]RWJ42127.1 MAG: KpsF/GutQ family sugar-phosphate isomerase [Mesorhizobium sp.]RWJ56980.1 MAG: KpsF/GutQ family sugar-phosphate isomerase [Mesorhizobium sp.]